MSPRFNLDEIRERVLTARREEEALTESIADATEALIRLQDAIGERPLNRLEALNLIGSVDRGDAEREAEDIRDRIRRLRAELEVVRARANRAEDQENLLQGDDIKDVQTLVEGAEASVPFVLFPVRIETRFGDRAGRLVLLVRIFPDDIHGQSQGQELDKEDLRLLTEFTADVEAGNREEAIELLLDKATPQQAAWVARHFDEKPPTVTEQPGESIGWLDLLPSRWLVEVRVDGEPVDQAVGKPIGEDVRAVLVQPKETDDFLSAEWLRDFNEAERLGMAIEVELEDEAAAAATGESRLRSSQPPANGIDVVVLGVNYELDAATGAEAIERAMTGHAFGGGLRLLPKGSPTNNTSSQRVAPALTSREQFNELVEPPSYAPDATFDAPLLEQALGVTHGTFASIARADGETMLADNQDARAMATALWPATQGYSGLEITRVSPPYGHFTRYVRAGGFLPAVAVGNMPYGFHVTGALDEVPREDLARRVVANTPFYGTRPWRIALESTPRIGEGLDPEELLDILKLGPSSAAFQIREGRQSLRARPPEFWNPLIEGGPFPALELVSYLPTLVFDAEAIAWKRGLLLDDSESPVSPQTYVAALRKWYQELKAGLDDVPTPEPHSAALLYVLLRYATAMTAAWSKGIPSLRVPEGGSPLLRYLDEQLGFQPGHAGGYPDLKAVREAFRPEGLQGVADPRATIEMGAEQQRIYLDRRSIEALTEIVGGEAAENLTMRLRADQPTVTEDEATMLGELGFLRSQPEAVGEAEFVELTIEGSALLQPGAVRAVEGLGGSESGDMRHLTSDPSMPGVPGDMPINPGEPFPFPEGPNGEPSGGPGGGPGGGGPFPDPDPEPDPDPLGPEDSVDPYDIPVVRPVIPPRYIPDRVDSVDVPQAQRAVEFDEALNRLAGMDLAKLERLMTETLDATHYRRDAWTSSIHTRHLEQMRAKHPTGSHLGGYGFVLGLRQELEPVQLTPHRRRAFPIDSRFLFGRDHDPQRRLEQGGFIAAQTPDQAAALAVIRNAYLAHARDETTADALRMNLDSGRVRVALELIDAVREANPPADVLGARFERLLHRRNLEMLDAGEIGSEGSVAQYLLAFRDQYPNRAEAEDSEGRHNRVVDGVALARAWKKSKKAPQPISELLPKESVHALHRPVLKAILDEFESQIDAANDLLLFEATFLATTGDSAAATRALDAHAGMTAPAAVASVATPAKGPGFTHRIVIPLEGIENPWQAPKNLRATVSPRTNDWAGMLLGPPGDLVWAYQGANGWVRRTLADTKLDALDVALDAERWARSSLSELDDARSSVPTAAIGRELAQHLMSTALAELGAAGPDAVAIRVDRALLEQQGFLDDGGIAISEIAELALRAGRTLRAARPLEPTDLAAAGVQVEGAPDMAEAVTRLTTGATVLDAAASALETLATNIEDAAPSALPALDAAAVAVVTAGNCNGAELDPRRPSLMTKEFLADHILAMRNAASRMHERAAATPTAIGDQDVASLAAAAAALIGRDLPFDIRFDLTPPHALDRALAGADKVGGPPLRTWFQQVARVLNNATNLELAALASEIVVQSDAGALQATQLPWSDDDPWIGGELDPSSDDDQAGIIGTTSICAVGPGELRSAAMSGLFVGVVNDRVPLADHTGGVAFRYDQPSARAPQVVAIAVPPTTFDVTEREEEGGEEEAVWQWEHLIGAVDTMIRDAQLRAADPNLIQGVGPALPTTLFPTSPSHDFYDINLKEMAQGRQLSADGGSP